MQGLVTNDLTSTDQQQEEDNVSATTSKEQPDGKTEPQSDFEHGLDSSFQDNQSVFMEHVSLEKLKQDITISTDESSIEFDDSEQQLILILKLGNLKHIKSFLRGRLWKVDHDIRDSLWLNLCRYFHKADGDIFDEMVMELFPDDSIHDIALPGFIDQHHLFPYYLNSDGIHHVGRIMAVINHMNPDITYCPPVFSLACLFLHYMNSNECFNCLYGLLRCKKFTYLLQTKVAWDASKYVLKDLAKKYAKSGYVCILRETSNIDGVFDRWLWWIFQDLPFDYIVKIIDSFLLEGVKVLYRVALAVLILYAKYNSKRASNREVLGTNTSSNLQRFCETMPTCINITKLLKVAFGIRGLTRKEIKKLQVKNEMFVNSKSVLPGHDISRSISHNSIRRGVSMSRSFSGPIILQNIGTNILNLEMSDTRSRSRSLGTYIFPSTKSHVVDHEDIHLIWSWLPARLAVCQPTLLYTSEEHGTSLRTLYSKIEDCFQSIIIIKTTRGEIFGAFCSASWCERRSSNKNLSYFGTGETFVFSLSPKKEKYEWVGMYQEEISKTSSMFLAGDNSVMTIGGGSGEAIQLDENLVHCRSERCDTFDNEPLSADNDFTCQVVEAFGFQ